MGASHIELSARRFIASSKHSICYPFAFWKCIRGTIIILRIMCPQESLSLRPAAVEDSHLRIPKFTRARARLIYCPIVKASSARASTQESKICPWRDRQQSQALLLHSLAPAKIQGLCNFLRRHRPLLRLLPLAPAVLLSMQVRILTRWKLRITSKYSFPP